MTKRFLAMMPWLIEIEGRKYENDPDDPGGASKFGIDQRSHPTVNIRSLTEEQATQIYWDEYWQKNTCDVMPYPLGEAFFDVCVNNGRSRADQLLSVSGDAKSFLDERDAFYKRLARLRPKSAKYLKGWLNRDVSLRKHLGL